MPGKRVKIGTIIDASYFEPYYIIKGNTGYSFKICPYCLTEIELGFEHFDGEGRTQGFAGTLPHECEDWVDEARHRNGYITNYRLPIDGFIFISGGGKR